MYIDTLYAVVKEQEYYDLFLMCSFLDTYITKNHTTTAAAKVWILRILFYFYFLTNFAHLKIEKLFIYKSRQKC